MPDSRLEPGVLFQQLARHPGVWAIEPERLNALLDFAARTPMPMVDEELVSRFEVVVARQQAKSRGEVARLSISGVIQPKTDIWSLYGFATALDAFGAEFQAAVNDTQVKGIVLDIDSPGGSVYGMTEMAKQIRAARGTKPIVSVATGMAASGGYYVASQADEVWAMPSGEVGSIGVVYVHFDQTAYLDQVGVKPTIFRSQPRKADVNPYENLTEEAAKDIQSKVDAYDRMFVSDVAKGRGVSTETVRKNYGAGRMFLATEAKAAGLIDYIGTADEAMSRVGSGRVPAKQQQAVADEGPTEQVERVSPDMASRLAEIALAGRRKGSHGN